MHELVQTFISKIVDETVGTRFNLAKAAPTGYNAMMASKATFSNAGNRRNTGELVKLRFSQMNGCAVCLEMHRKNLRACGAASAVRPGLHSVVELRSTGQPRRLSLQARLFWLDHFYVDCDCDFVAYYSGSALYTEILAVNLRCRGGADALVSPWIFDRRRWSIHIKHDFFGRAVNGQVACDL